MFEYLFEWLQNISYYMILVTAVTYILPSSVYRKYIRFFTGLVLILMLITPVLNLFGMKIPGGDDIFGEFLSGFPNSMPEYVESMEGLDNRSDNQIQIEVEDIVIGP